MLAKNHYEDCPYGCNPNGMLLDSNVGKLIPCPYCSQKKKELLKKGYVETTTDDTVPLATVLGIENEFLSTSFVYEGIVPEGEKVFIEDESLAWQESEANDLYSSLVIGELPKESVCFGISIKGKFEQFVYPMLAKAYLAGLTVGKFVSCSEFNRLAFDIKNPIEEFYNADVVFMLINDGANLADLSSAKGLMQTRALKGKPTFFVTTWTVEACSGLLGYKDDASLSLARPIFLKYKKSKNKGHSSYINGMIGVENESVGQTDGPVVSMSDLLNF